MKETNPEKKCQPVLTYKTRVPSHLNISIKPKKTTKPNF